MCQLPEVIELNNRAIDHLCRGEDQKALSIFSRALSLLSVSFQRLERDEQSDACEMANVAFGTVCLKPRTWSTDSRKAQGILDNEAIPLFERAMAVSLEDFDSSNVVRMVSHKVTGAILFNTALTFHRRAVADRSNTKALRKALTLYKNTLSALTPTFPVFGREPMLVLLLAVYTNMTHIYGDVYDREGFESSRSALLQLTNMADFTLLSHADATFFAFQKCTLHVNAFSTAAAA